MKKKLYINNISSSNTLSLDWLKFVEERRNNDFKQCHINKSTDKDCFEECNNQKFCGNNLSEIIQGISEPICLKELLGYKDTSIYGYFTSSILYEDILDRSKLIVLDYKYESGNNSIFNEDSDIYITEQGTYRITYGVICSTAIRGSLYLLLNNMPIYQESKMNRVSLTQYTTKLRLNNGDILSLMVKGEFIKLYSGGINGFVLIEKCS